MGTFCPVSCGSARASGKARATLVPWHGSASLVQDGGGKSAWSCAGLSLVCHPESALEPQIAHSQPGSCVAGVESVGSRAGGWLGQAGQ